MQLALWICSFQNGNALKKFIEFSSFHHLIGLLLLRRVKWETERSLNKLKWYFRPTFKYEFDSEIDPERLNYVYIYTGLIVAVLYLVFQRAMALFCFCLKASRRIHEKLFNGVTRAKMYFFNTNSSGRIINRFSKDINDIDYYLPSVLYDSILVSEKRITNESILLNSQLMESTPKKIPKYRKKLIGRIFSLRSPVFASNSDIIDFGVSGELLAVDTNALHESYILWYAAYLCEDCQVLETSRING